MFGFLKKKPAPAPEKKAEAGTAPAPRKVFVIGMDCMTPQLLFHQWREELPNFNRLMSNGAYGELESCMPCITVPAWSVMTSSKDPGTLGIYGFRNRVADEATGLHPYDKMGIANGTWVKEERVWEILSRYDKKVNVVGVPGTFPPKPVNGVLVGCFLTPATVKKDPATGQIENKIFTFPAEMSAQINSWADGEYLVDVKDFRTEDKEYLLDQIYVMTERRFAVVKKLMKEKPWDFMMYVEMGTDRIHHGFWKQHDPTHPQFAPGNPWVNSIHDYYKRIDQQVGELLDMLDDNTVVLVVSDHGAKRMIGGICFNEWLRQEGYLVLKEEPPAGRLTPLDKCEVDWSKTIAWGDGGYYGRCFLNLKGREPQGTVDPADYDKVRDELIRKLEAITDEYGQNIGTVVHKPEKIYKQVKGVAPDLVVYFGNLEWRSVGSLGHGSIWTHENDTGPDDANHAQYGIFIMYDPKHDLGGRELTGLQIMDFAPTVLDLFGLPVPADMQGKVIRPEA